jgi:excisionase family DNA binding protein
MAGKRASPTIPVSTTERLLSFAEAATRLNLGVSTLRQKLHAGCGPVAIRLPGSTHWRFRPRDLDAYERAAEISPEKMASAASAAEELTN